MAELTIRLRLDPATGRKNILVELQSDADALPHEHELDHRALVDRLLAGGALAQAELGHLIIERAGERTTIDLSEDAPAAAEPVRHRDRNG